MKALRPLFSFSAFILLVGLACSAITGREDSPTQLSSPTQPVQVISTEAVPTTNGSTPTEPSAADASNFYMATEKDATNRTNTFLPTDDFYVFFDVSGIEAGMNFQARWYALDIEGEDPNVPFQTIDYAYEEGISTIYFQLTSSEDWPTGTYKVEVYMNGTKVGEQEFSVQ